MAAVKVSTQIGLILQECQEQSFTEARNASRKKRLWRLFREDDEAFQTAFFKHVNRVLVIFKQDPSTERVVHLIADFINFEPQSPGAAPGTKVLYWGGDDLGIALIEHLLEFSNAADKAVRFRVCQLVALVMTNLSEDAEISEELWEDVIQHMLKRSRDKVLQVRVHAVAALGRMQDAADPDDVVTAECLRLLASDTSPAVRKSVLSMLGVSKHTLPSLLERHRDVDESTRVATFKLLADSVRIKHLKIAQRVDLIENGLQDRAPKVQEAATQMLLCWLDQLDMDPLALLACLDVEENEEDGAKTRNEKVAVLALRRVFTEARQPGATKKLREAAVFDVDVESLQPESALFWCERCHFLSDLHTNAHGGPMLTSDERAKIADELDDLLPPLAPVCDLIDSHMDQGHAFVMRQLLGMARLLDCKEEAGRRRLLGLSEQLLKDEELPHTLADVTVRAAARAHPSDRDFVLFATQLMAEVRDDQDLDQTLKEDQPPSTPEAEEEKAEEEAERQVWALQRCLSVTSVLLETTQCTLANPSLSSLLHTTVLPAMQQPDDLTREEAVRCIGLYCLLDPTGEQAKAQLPLLLHTMCNDADSVRTVCLKAIFDILVVCPELCLEELEREDDEEEGEGEEGKEQEQEGEETTVPTKAPQKKPDSSSQKAKTPTPSIAETVTSTLIWALEDQDIEVCSTAVEGFGRLLATGRLSGWTGNESAVKDILSRFLVLLFNPAGQETPSLRQCLTLFFQVFCSAKGAEGAHNRHLLEQAVVPTLALINDAPPDVEAAPLEQVVGCLLNLIAMGDAMEDEDAGEEEENTDTDAAAKESAAERPASVQARVGISLAIEAITMRDGASAAERTLCKALIKLGVPETDTVGVAALKYLSEFMIGDGGLADKTANKSATAFAQQLDDMQQRQEHAKRDGKAPVLHPPAGDAAEFEGDHEDDCAMCGQEGEVGMCFYCPNVCHVAGRCTKKLVCDIERDDWYCNSCNARFGGEEAEKTSNAIEASSGGLFAMLESRIDARRAASQKFDKAHGHTSRRTTSARNNNARRGPRGGKKKTATKKKLKQSRRYSLSDDENETESEESSAASSVASSADKRPVRARRSKKKSDRSSIQMREQELDDLLATSEDDEEDHRGEQAYASKGGRMSPVEEAATLGNIENVLGH